MSAYKHLLGLSFICLVGLDLSGCSCTGNPATDGYACGRQGIEGGGYNQRVMQKQQAVQDTQDESVQQKRQLDDLNAQQQSEKQDIDKISSQLADLDRELNDLNKRVEVSKSNKAVDQAKLVSLQKQINSVKTQTAVAKADTISSDADRRAELARLQKQYDELQKELLLMTGGS